MTWVMYRSGARGRGFDPTRVAVLCNWTRHIYSPKKTDNTQDPNMTKIVYRDVKHQTNSNKKSLE